LQPGIGGSQAGKPGSRFLGSGGIIEYPDDKGALNNKLPKYRLMHTPRIDNALRHAEGTGQDTVNNNLPIRGSRNPKHENEIRKKSADRNSQEYVPALVLFEISLGTRTSCETSCLPLLPSFALFFKTKGSKVTKETKRRC